MENDNFVLIVAGGVISAFSSLTIATYEQELLLHALVPSMTFVTFLLNYNLKKKMILHDDRKKHTQDIQKIYYLLTDVVIRENDRKKKFVRTFPREYIPNKYHEHLKRFMLGESEPLNDRIDEEYLDQSPNYKYYEFALEHLKCRKYKDIYKNWKEIHNLLDDLNKKPSFRTKLKELINEKMQDQLPEIKQGYSQEPNYCYPVRIFEFILDSIQSENNTVSLELINRENNDQLIRSIGDSEEHIIIDCTNYTCFERYKNMCNDILCDNNLRKYFDHEHMIMQKIHSEIEQFAKKLGELAKRLDAGEIIVGKCKIGY